MQLINWIIQVLLMIGSVFLGYYLNEKNWYIVTCTIVILAEAILISMLINFNNKIKNELKEQKDLFSRELLGRKTNGENTADITVFPLQNSGDKAISRDFLVTINTPKNVDKGFDLQLISDKSILLKVNKINNINKQYHTGRHIFLISGNFLEKHEGKYHKMEINITMSSKDPVSIELTAQNQEISSSKTFLIHP